MGNRPKRSLGQNFLVDPNLQRKIAAAAGRKGDLVLEIGPGRGALTDHLLRQGVTLHAVEIDNALAAALAAKYAANPRMTVTCGDVTRLDLALLTGDWPSTRVVGNIPYNLTTPIIFRLLEHPYPADIVLTVQAEVAVRILAAPGTRTYGALSIGVALHAIAERLFKVPRTAFRPVPKVDSVSIRLTPRSPPLLSPEAAARTRRLVRAAFSWRRTQLGKTLARHPDLRLGPRAAAALQARSISASVRPEQVPPEEFAALADMLLAPPADP